jgi:hypothetical protein
MAEFVHTFRPNTFSSERSFRLGPDALIWKDAKGEDRVDYGEIASLNIASMTPPYGKPQSRCVLHTHSGGKIVLQSMSYKRLGVVEDCTATYAALVQELMQRIIVANPEAKFIAGQPWAVWCFWLIILIASALIVLFALILALTGEFPLPAAAAMMIVVAGIPLGWRVVRHGRPHPFDPRTLKGGELPG